MKLCLLMVNKRSHFLQGNSNRRRLARSVVRNYKFHILVPSWRTKLLVLVKWDYCTQKIQQCWCCATLLVIELFLGIVGPEITRSDITGFVAFVFWGGYTKNRNLQKNWNKIFRCTFQASLNQQCCFTPEEKSGYLTFLSAVDISGT